MTPKRPENHIIGSEALAIVEGSLPRGWILRRQSSDDYGIDAEVEAVLDGEVTGDLVKVQVRGHKSLDLSSGFHGEIVRTDQLGYWLRIPVPTLLFVVDVTSRKVIIADAAKAARRHLPTDKSSVKVKMTGQLELGSSAGNLYLICCMVSGYWQACFERAKKFWTDYRRFVEISDFCHGADFFLCAEEDELDFVRAFIECARSLRYSPSFLVNSIEPIPWKHWEEEAMVEWKTGWHRDIPYAVLAKACDDAMPLISALLDRFRAIVLNEERRFWEKRAPELVRTLSQKVG